MNIKKLFKDNLNYRYDQWRNSKKPEILKIAGGTESLSITNKSKEVFILHYLSPNSFYVTGDDITEIIDETEKLIDGLRDIIDAPEELTAPPMFGAVIKQLLISCELITSLFKVLVYDAQLGLGGIDILHREESNNEIDVSEVLFDFNKENCKGIAEAIVEFYDQDHTF